MSEIFDVYSNPTRFQNCLDCNHHFFRSLTKSSDDVSREWNRQDPCDSFDSWHEFIPTHHLAVRVSKGDHEPRARSCNCRKPLILKDACAWNIPRVRKNQYSLPMMKSAEILSSIFLGTHPSPLARNASIHLSSFASRID